MSQKHFTIDERESILEFLILGFSYAKIGRSLNRHRSSIGREIKRNSIKLEFVEDISQKTYQEKGRKSLMVSKKQEKNPNQEDD